MLLDELRERGFIANISDEAALTRKMAAGGITLYLGIDPTAASLHVGHLLQVILLMHFQRAGHRPIALVGGGTGLVGDPSERSSIRPMLTVEDIQHNLLAIRAQLQRFVDFSNQQALLVNNADWLLPLHYIAFLRDIGRHFTVNQLMQHETYRERYETGSFSFIELNYALVQAYDFLHLFRTEGAILQVGGNDQWFNILAGTELIRRVEGAEAFALTSPLLTTASGRKMGKTEGGAVWLDPSLTPPYDFFQYWRNTEDLDVGRFLRLYTLIPLAEIKELEALQGAELNRAKERLAFEMTRMVHGEEEASSALQTARARFGGGGADEGPSLVVGSTQDVDVEDVLVQAGLAASKSAAKRLIRGGGVRLGGELVAPGGSVDPRLLPTLLSVGKRRVRLAAE